MISQLKTDLKRNDLNVVIGRISDYGNTDPERPHWNLVREAEVRVADSVPFGAWVDTDDLNGDNNGLHYNKDGYKVLGERFAEKTIALIQRRKSL